MTRLVELVAPRTWAGAVLRAALVVAFIHALNFTLNGVAEGLSYSIHDAILTTCLAFPMFTGFMAMLKHLRRLQHELTLLATTDVLTGLPNRRAFLARAAEATAGGRSGALLLLDADHFKRVNDTWGHAVGDLCLRAIGEHLRRAVRPGDMVGRLGGEEFSVFLPGASRDDAARLGERLCRAIAVEAEGAEAALRVTLSAGAALGGGPVSRLLGQADAALYRAKAEGRARLVIWTEDGPPADAEASRAA